MFGQDPVTTPVARYGLRKSESHPHSRSGSVVCAVSPVAPGVTEADIRTNVTGIALMSARISTVVTYRARSPTGRRDCINPAIARALTPVGGPITFRMHLHVQ